MIKNYVDVVCFLEFCIVNGCDILVIIKFNCEIDIDFLIVCEINIFDIGGGNVKLYGF